MKDENKTKAELIKELKALRKEKGKSTINNIHERKQAEEVLKESEGKLRNIFENSTTVFYSHTPEDLLTFISPQVEDVLGYTQEEAMIKWTKFVSDNPLNEIAFKYTLKAIETGKRQPPYEAEFVKKNGEKIWIEVREFPEIKDGQTIAIIGSFTDITERKQAEEVLKESEGKLRNIFENSTNLFYSHTPEHVLTYLSPQVEDILGYTQEEAMIKWTKLTSDNPVNEIGFKYTVKAIENGKRQPPYELELVKKNGEKI